MTSIILLETMSPLLSFAPPDPLPRRPPAATLEEPAAALAVEARVLGVLVLREDEDAAPPGLEDDPAPDLDSLMVSFVALPSTSSGRGKSGWLWTRCTLVNRPRFPSRFPRFLENPTEIIHGQPQRLVRTLESGGFLSVPMYAPCLSQARSFYKR